MPPTTTGNTNKTNTGKKDPEGRTIWRGPRGGLFVQKNGRNVRVATPTTARAASKWLGELSFTNHITLDEHKRKHGIVLRGKYYHPEGLRRWIESGGKTVPHTGERMTNAEIRRHGPGAPRRSSSGSSTHARAGHGHGGSNSNSNATSGRRLNRPSASENVNVHLAIFTRADVNARGHPIRHPEVRDIDLPAMTALSQIFRRLPAIDRVEIIRPGHPIETVRSTTLENVGHFAYSRGGGWEAYVRVFYR